MTPVTQLLEAAQHGDRQAATALLPLVYDELRKLAAVRMSSEAAGHTLDATALVHEAYLKLVGEQKFDGRGHFFAAAAEAMRRILVDAARRKRRVKHGGASDRLELLESLAAPEVDIEDILAVNEAIDELAEQDSAAAEIVKLHYFAGFTLEQSAEVLGISQRTAYRTWSFARAWLFRKLGDERGERTF